VSGLLSILSYTPNVYTKDMVGAIECLAESLGTALQREREDEARRHRHRATGLRGGMGETSIPNPPLVLDTVSERLKHIRQRAESLRHLIAESALSSDCAVLRAAEELTLEMFLRTTTVAENPLARLTSREREVAILLVSGQSNRQIAERLFVSEKTAKTHVGNILQKLGTGGRSGVAQLLKPYLCLPTTPMA
jgi:DNA-binding CsgD family transcriptional regulator